MLVLMSPAKTISEEYYNIGCEQTQPGFDSCTQELLETLQSCSKAALQQALGVSPSLARQAAVLAGWQLDGGQEFTVELCCAVLTTHGTSHGLNKPAKLQLLHLMVLLIRHWTQLLCSTQSCNLLSSMCAFLMPCMAY